MATFAGYAPSAYYSLNNPGLLIWISPGSVNGVVAWNGGTFAVLNNNTTTVYADSSGILHQGQISAGGYGIALVTATGGKIVNIIDIRTNPISSSAIGNFSTETVPVSGTSWGPISHPPNGILFLFFKNGQLLQSSADYTGFGQTSGTLVVSAGTSDSYLMVYTY